MRIGIDLGGTKIEGIVLDDDGRERRRQRVPTPRGDYEATLLAVTALVQDLGRDLGGIRGVGIGHPGAISPATGLIKNANSTWLNGQRLDADLAAELGRPVRTVNDANCLALSEAADGAGKGARSLLGVILGTGTGSGLVFDGRVIDGPRGTGGEWGHNPLPWPGAEELPGPDCWCGLKGCMEVWVSGPALHGDYLVRGGDAALAATGEEVFAQAGRGDALAQAALDRHASRLARGLAVVTNIFDPEVIVLGGGLSRMPHLYDALPRLMARYIFADHRDITIRQPVHGDASGGRGAARLWDTP
jgi:fructokinase